MSDNRERNSEASRRDVGAELDLIRERIARRIARPNVPPPEFEKFDRSAAQPALDTAQRMAALIGTLNPRPAGFVNDLIQAGKNLFARSLQWMVRPQREFNAAVVRQLKELDRQLDLANRVSGKNFDRATESLSRHRDAMGLLGDELDSFSSNEIHRVLRRMDALEDKMQQHRWAYEGAMARQSRALQERMYQSISDLQDHILGELRDLRQRVAAQARSVAAGTSVAGGAPAAVPAATSVSAGIDYFQLERHFRGSEEEIRKRQSFYLPFFQGRRNVLDIACGRGEFLELMRQAGVASKGVDIDADMIGRCVDKGLEAIRSDVFQYLESIPDGSLDGVFCAQFVEHLESSALVRLIAKCHEKLAPGGAIAIETPNPECLATMSQNFYCDPTHIRPVPAALLRVLLAEAGMVKSSVHYLFPAFEILPAIPKLETKAIDAETLKAWNAAVTKFNETYFGGLDYAVIAYRPESLIPAAGSK